MHTNEIVILSVSFLNFDSRSYVVVVDKGKGANCVVSLTLAYNTQILSLKNSEKKRTKRSFNSFSLSVQSFI